MRAKIPSRLPARWSASILGLFLCALALADAGGRSSAQIWTDMVWSSLTGDALPIPVEGTREVVSFGGEKEGSSALITRVMGPKGTSFGDWVRGFEPEAREKFLRALLSGWSSGALRQRGVRDAAGKSLDFEWKSTAAQVRQADLPALDRLFGEWLAKTADRPFVFLKPATRMKIAKGQFAEGGAVMLPKGYDSKGISFDQWVPHYGEAERFIQAAHATGKGWEINFVPQRSYGEWEKLIAWFQNELKNAGVPFEAPGHHWIVYPKRLGQSDAERVAMESRLSEMYRMVQAYIVLEGIAGGSGIELSAHKNVHSDQALAGLDPGRGVVRPDTKLPAGTQKEAYNIELRAGTKHHPIRREIQQVIAARYAAGDFSDLKPIESWGLVPEGGFTAEAIAERFGVSRIEAAIMLKRVEGLSVQKGPDEWDTRSISRQYLVPLWNWVDAPFLGTGKREQIRELGASFVRMVASRENLSLNELRESLRTWTEISGLRADVRRYLRPKLAVGASVAELLEFRPMPRTQSDGSIFTPFSKVIREMMDAVRGNTGDAKLRVDTNRVDLGIEYSGRFPIKLKSQYTEQRLADGKRGWLWTDHDFTPEQRDQFIRKFAGAIGDSYGPRGSTPERVGGGHGHDLVVAYTVRDGKGRKWRAEWDGVGRDYDPSGKVIPGSGRGGHLEVVTPKFNPTAGEIETLFGLFSRYNVDTTSGVGGGHINIDLAPFRGRPKELARFLLLFLQNRDVITTLYQKTERLTSAEPIEISPKLAQALRDFQGTETELKQLLYRERYFNTRVGRKTRYIQLDLSAYFQDVIPADFVRADFDLKNDPWRRNFNVDPQVRKAEFRLFDAPRDPVDAALQIRLVRALLHRALNVDQPLPERPIPAVDPAVIAADPRSARARFEHFMTELGLDSKHYEYVFVEGLSDMRQAVESPYYQPLEQRLVNSPKQGGWGEPVSARSGTRSLIAEERPVRPGAAIDPAAKTLMDQRREARVEVERERALRAAERLPRLDEYLKKPALIVSMTAEAVRKLEPSLRLAAIAGRAKSTQVSAQARAADAQTLKALRAKSDFIQALTQAYSDALGTRNVEYRRWLYGLIGRKKGAESFYGLVVLDSDPGLSGDAMRRLQDKNLSERANLIQEHLYSSYDYDGEGSDRPGVRVGNGLKFLLEAPDLKGGQLEAYGVDSLLSRAFKESSPYEMRLAIEFVLRSEPRNVVDVLLGLPRKGKLADRFVAFALMGMRTPEARAGLARMAGESQDPVVKQYLRRSERTFRSAALAFTQQDLTTLNTSEALALLFEARRLSGDSKLGAKALTDLRKRPDFISSAAQLFAADANRSKPEFRRFLIGTLPQRMPKADESYSSEGEWRNQLRELYIAARMDRDPQIRKIAIRVTQRVPIENLLGFVWQSLDASGADVIRDLADDFERRAKSGSLKLESYSRQNFAQFALKLFAEGPQWSVLGHRFLKLSPDFAATRASLDSAFLEEWSFLNDFDYDTGVMSRENSESRKHRALKAALITLQNSSGMASWVLENNLHLSEKPDIQSLAVKIVERGQKAGEIPIPPVVAGGDCLIQGMRQEIGGPDLLRAPEI